MQQSCIISQRKTGWWGLLGFRFKGWCFGVCLRKSAWSAGDFWVSSLRIDWVRLRVILTQIAQITQRNAAKLHYFAEKDSLCSSCCFEVCLRKSARSARDIVVSLWLLEYSCVIILPQIAQITQRNAASCIISQRKTGCWGVRLFCCFGVCQRKSARSAGDIGV